MDPRRWGRRTLIATRTWSPREGGRRWLVLGAVLALVLVAVTWAARRTPSASAPPTQPGTVRQMSPVQPAASDRTSCSSAPNPADVALTSPVGRGPGPPTSYLSLSCSGWGPFRAPEARSRPFCPHGDRRLCYPASGAFRVMFSTSGCGAGSLVLAVTTTSGASLARLVNANCAGESPAYTWPDAPDGVAITISTAPRVRWTFVLFELADCGRCP